MPYGPVTPSKAIQDVAEYLELLEDAAEARRGDLLKMGKVCEDFSAYYRALGICLLSGYADVDGFFHHVVQSALTRRHYLQGIQRLGGGEPGYRRASFIDPVLDAIAARQWHLADEIVHSVSHAWLEGEEYEDDFCYAEFLRRILTEGGAGVDELLARWEKALEGGVDLRLGVAKAIHARDQVAFSEALTRLLDAKDAEARRIADPIKGSMLASDLTFFPNRWVSVEGLALLALGERQGLGPLGEFSACPPLARGKGFAAFQPLGFPNVSFTQE